LKAKGRDDNAAVRSSKLHRERGSRERKRTLAATLATTTERKRTMIMAALLNHGGSGRGAASSGGSNSSRGCPIEIVGRVIHEIVYSTVSDVFTFVIVVVGFVARAVAFVPVVR
jgi:hypothetical protein